MKAQFQLYIQVYVCIQHEHLGHIKTLTMCMKILEPFLKAFSKMYTHILTYGMQSIQVFPPNFPNIFSFVQTISVSERRQQNLVLQKILLPSVWRIHICLEVFHQNTKDISYISKIFIILKRGLPSFITLMASEVAHNFCKEENFTQFFVYLP